MQANLRAQIIQAFAKYLSADGTSGVTNSTGGLIFKNGLYVGGTVSAVSTSLAPDSITLMGTPTTLTVATGNSASGTTHSHAITSSADPGAAAAILATDASGFLRLVRLGIGVAPTQPLHVAGNAFLDAVTANLYMKDTSTG